jgi:hypothetical protein
MSKSSPVIAAAKERGQSPDEIVFLSTGVRARIKAVSASLLDDVTARIVDPEIPLEPNPDKNDRLEPNPYNAQYKKDMDQANRERGIAALDAMIMFGIELVDPIPDNSEWMPKLRFLEKRGHLNLNGVDLDDPIEREFTYKRLIAVGNEDLKLIGRSGGLSEEEVKRVENSFQGS